MGYALRVYFVSFCGHAVGNSFAVGGASAPGSSRFAPLPQVGGSTVPRSQNQPQNWLQMVAPLSSVRWSWIARAVAAASALPAANSQLLAQGAGSAAPSAFWLGCQKNSCPTPTTTSPRDVALRAHHSAMAQTAALRRQTGASSQAWTTTASAGFDSAAGLQRRVDSRLQRVVPNAQWPARRSIDRARYVQPLHPGYPALAPSARAGSAVFPGAF